MSKRYSPIDIWEDIKVNNKFVLVKIDDTLQMGRNELFELSAYKSPSATSLAVGKKLMIGKLHKQEFYREGKRPMTMFTLKEVEFIYHAYPNMRQPIRDVLQEVLDVLKGDIYFQGVQGDERKAMRKQLKKFLKKGV